MRDIYFDPVNHLVDPHGCANKQLLGMMLDIRIDFRREVAGDRFALLFVIAGKGLDRLFRFLECRYLCLDRLGI